MNDTSSDNGSSKDDERRDLDTKITTGTTTTAVAAAASLPLTPNTPRTSSQQDRKGTSSSSPSRPASASAWYTLDDTSVESSKATARISQRRRQQLLLQQQQQQPISSSPVPPSSTVRGGNRDPNTLSPLSPSLSSAGAATRHPRPAPKFQSFEDRRVSWGDEQGDDDGNGYEDDDDDDDDGNTNTDTNANANVKDFVQYFDVAKEGQGQERGERHHGDGRRRRRHNPIDVTDQNTEAAAVTTTTKTAAAAAVSSSRHARKISWGGTTIEIPDAFESHLSLDRDDDPDDVFGQFGRRNPLLGVGSNNHPPHTSPSLRLPLQAPSLSLPSATQWQQTRSLLGPPPPPPMTTPIQSATLYHGSDYTKLELDDSERTRVAAMAVQAAENALHSLAPSFPSTSTSAASTAATVNIVDLAKVHPFESRAEGQILKSIEASNRAAEAAAAAASGSIEGGGEDDDEDEYSDVDAVASLFTPVSEALLGNVPEGSEAIFQHPRSTTSSGPRSNDSVTSWNADGGEYSTSGSERGGTSNQQQKCSNAPDSPPPPAPAATTSFVGGNDSRGKSEFSSSDHQRSRHRRGTSNVRGMNNHAATPKIAHRRQKTLEETLTLFNQTMTVDSDLVQAAANEVGSGTEFNLSSYDQDETSYRRRTTSLDLLNDNMTRLFGGDTEFSNSTILEPHPIELLPLNTVQETKVSNPVDDVPISSSHCSKDRARYRVDSDSDSASLFDEENPRKKKSNQGSVVDNTHPQGEKVDDDKKAEFNSAFPDRRIFVPDLSNIDYSQWSFRKRKRSVFVRFCQKIGLLQNLDDFLRPWRPSIWKYMKNYFWLLVISIGVAAVLFYAGGNPPTSIVDFEASQTFNGTTYVTVQGNTIDPNARASYSWWTLFAFTRLPITCALAKTLELVLIDFMILNRRWIASCIGPTLTLLIVQSKGWPSTVLLWSLCNLGLLCGDSAFVAHWGYWQDYVGLFNLENPSGGIPSSDMNLRVQLIALGVSVCVAIKRLLIGYQQGRNIYLYYVEDLSKIVTKILLISEVAALAARLDREMMNNEGDYEGEKQNISRRARSSGIDDATRQINEDLDNDNSQAQEAEDNEDSVSIDGSIPTDRFANEPSASKKLLIADQETTHATGRLTRSQARRIERLLGNWNEHEKETSLRENVSIGAILQFRTSLRKLDSPFPFSYAFGRADSRDRCIHASQDLYLRLLRHSLDPTLHFNILGLVALERDGSLNYEKLRLLMKVFRPGRDGRLSLIDFVKSVDAIYKEMKMLRASVRSSQKIDQASERIFNVVFYAVIGCVALAALGLDPLAIFVSLSTIVLAFSFMISRASSNYFEGLLFILYRRPYDIGDRIVVQPVDAETSEFGSSHWIVRDIDLFTTTVIYAYTNEVATLNNGSIANCRILNGARSLPSLNYVYLRFGIDVTFEQIEIFREGLALYVDARPREWSKLWAVRAMRVQSDQGFVEYCIILEHVDNWQNLDGILYSRGQVRSFCHELAKQLQMRYISPPLPVDLTIRGGLGGIAGDLAAAGIVSDNPEGYGGTTGGGGEGSSSNLRSSNHSENIRGIITDLNRYENIDGRPYRL